MDENAAANDEDDKLGGREEPRDYEAMGQALPIFCVSSRGYQQLRGRAGPDTPIIGFRNEDETEIPRLQQYAKSLTHGAETHRLKKMLNQLRGYLCSLMLWTTGATAASSQPILDNLKQKYEQSLLGAAMDKFKEVSRPGAFCRRKC